MLNLQYMLMLLDNRTKCENLLKYNRVERFHPLKATVENPLLDRMRGNPDEFRIWTYAYNIKCQYKCFCSIGHNVWVTQCVDVKVKFQLRILLTCNPNTAGLSFSDRKLSSIDFDTFWCFKSLKKLVLNGNKIKVLPRHVLVASIN